jgi:hypothetical protein
MEYYKIRNKNTGLFSSGGSSPTFKKIGKIWPLGQLKLHLTMIKNGRGSFEIYKDCELVTFTMDLQPAKITLKELIEPREADLIVKKLKGS